MLKILVNFATRSRPEKFKEVYSKLIDLADDTDNMVIVVKIDKDDPTSPHVIAEACRWPSVETILVLGSSTCKIDAINRDLDPEIIEDWDILVNVSDDMIPVRKGWDTVIRKDFKKHGLKLCAHYSDGTPVQDRLITMSVMGRKLYDFLGYVYHPSYVSLWCDNEFTEVCKTLGCYKYFGGVNHDRVLFKHNHPAWVKGVETDAQYIKTESYYSKDELNYKQRKKTNFGLTEEKIKQFHAKD